MRDRGIDAFWETCFRSAHGLVCLRERSGEPARLIYSTPPEGRDAEEAVQVIRVRQTEPVIDALLGVAELLGVVTVDRHLFDFRGARIALDSVQGLGEFVTIRVPIEAQDSPGLAHAQLEGLRAALRIDSKMVTEKSYAELLSKRQWKSGESPASRPSDSTWEST